MGAIVDKCGGCLVSGGHWTEDSAMDREKLLEMSGRKKEMEKEMQDIVEWLKFSPESGGVALSGGLVDKEGFPIADTEKVIAVREKRNRLAVLKTDIKQLDKDISDGLIAFHQQTKK